MPCRYYGFTEIGGRVSAAQRKCAACTFAVSVLHDERVGGERKGNVFFTTDLRTMTQVWMGRRPAANGAGRSAAKGRGVPDPASQSDVLVPAAHSCGHPAGAALMGRYRQHSQDAAEREEKTRDFK